ncbi:MAG: DUF2911 domain-containing protein [Blastocatellia bacterium]
MKLNRTLSVLAVLVMVVVAIAAQKPSPPKSAEMMLNGKKITIKYSAPSMRGRKIVGGLVPYGQVWRTGANEATTLVTEADLMFGNVAVPKGSYTLYTLPSETGWKLIINKQTGQWGTQYSEQQDLARIDMKITKTAAPVEQFVITLAPAGKGGVLKMEWENTSASVDLKLK